MSHVDEPTVNQYISEYPPEQVDSDAFLCSKTSHVDVPSTSDASEPPNKKSQSLPAPDSFPKNQAIDFICTAGVVDTSWDRDIECVYMIYLMPIGIILLFISAAGKKQC